MERMLGREWAYDRHYSCHMPTNLHPHLVKLGSILCTTQQISQYPFEWLFWVGSRRL